ncbi:MAG: hypothetical protein ACR2O2_03130 [Ruegeria sp.]
MKRIISLSILLAVGACTTSEQAGTAKNGYKALPVDNNIFEVVPGSRQDIDGYWCAAADFARRAMGAGWQQSMYVVRGYGPSVTTGRRTAVQFALDPQAAGITPREPGGVISGFQVGDSMSVQRGNGLCKSRPFLR